MSGVLWALGIYFSLRTDVYDPATSVAIWGIAVSVPYAVMAKKRKLEIKEALQYTLRLPYTIIAGDFGMHWLAFGTVACVAGLTNALEKNQNVSFFLFLLLVHFVLFLAIRLVLWDFGDFERRELKKLIEVEKATAEDLRK